MGELMKKAFDNKKYLTLQKEHIMERINMFGGKLYLELGDKLFDDLHASRVLPGFEPDVKIKLLESMKDNSKEIRIVGGITNSKIFLQVIREITGRNIKVVNGETAGAVGSAIMAGIGTGYYSDEKNAVL